MKTNLIALLSITTAVLLLMVSNSSNSFNDDPNTYNSKVCKHNGQAYKVIPKNERCVYTHSQMNPSPAVHFGKESHLCILTDEPLSMY